MVPTTKSLAVVARMLPNTHREFSLLTIQEHREYARDEPESPRDWGGAQTTMDIYRNQAAQYRLCR